MSRARTSVIAVAVGGLAATAALVGVGSSTAATTEDWPMFGHDQVHSGVSAETAIGASNAADLTVAWQANTGSSNFTSPAVATSASLGRTLVYEGSQGGAMSAYDARTGERVWAFKVPAHIQSSPAVVNDVLYFGASDRNFYALNASTGALVCKADVGGVISSSPVVVDPDGTGLVAYFGDNGMSGNDDGGHILAFNAVDPNAAADCSKKWSFNGFGDPPGSQPLAGSWSPPAFARDRFGRGLIVAGGSSPDCAVYAVDALTGELVWRFQTEIFAMDNDVGAGPTISAPGVNGFEDGVAYIAGKDRIVHALNLRTGQLIWKFNIRTDAPKVYGATRSTAALLGDRLFIGYGAGVYALDAKTGAKIWRSEGGTEVISSPAIGGAAGDEVLFVGDLGGVVRGLRVSDGQQLWSYDTGAFIYGSAAISQGRMFIASSSGLLFAFGIASGGASAPPQTAITSPTWNQVVTNPQGNLVFTGTAGDDLGVTQVQVGIKNRSNSKWWDGATKTWTALFTPNTATLSGPETSPTWSYAWPAPAAGGEFAIQAEAVDADGQHDPTLESVNFSVTPLGDPPNTTVDSPSNLSITYFPGGVRQEFDLQVKGTATDAGAVPGVSKVWVTIKNREHGDYFCATCTPKWSPTVKRNLAVLGSPGATSTTWSLTMRTYDHPHSYHVQAWAVDKENREDTTRAMISRFCVRDTGFNEC